MNTHHPRVSQCPQAREIGTSLQPMYKRNTATTAHELVAAVAAGGHGTSDRAVHALSTSRANGTMNWLRPDNKINCSGSHKRAKTRKQIVYEHECSSHVLLAQFG
jgi:hypothetical protein